MNFDEIARREERKDKKRALYARMVSEHPRFRAAKPTHNRLKLSWLLLPNLPLVGSNPAALREGYCQAR